MPPLPSHHLLTDLAGGEKFLPPHEEKEGRLLGGTKFPTKKKRWEEEKLIGTNKKEEEEEMPLGKNLAEKRQKGYSTTTSLP